MALEEGHNLNEEGKMALPNDSKFNLELSRRLALIESEDYIDPARQDLPVKDILLLLFGIVAVIIVSTMVLY